MLSLTHLSLHECVRPLDRGSQVLFPPSSRTFEPDAREEVRQVFHFNTANQQGNSKMMRWIVRTEWKYVHRPNSRAACKREVLHCHINEAYQGVFLVRLNGIAIGDL